MKTVGRLRDERNLKINPKPDSGYHRQLIKVYQKKKFL